MVYLAVQKGGHLLLSPSLANLFMSSLGCSEKWASLAISVPLVTYLSGVGMLRKDCISCYLLLLLTYLWAHWVVQERWDRLLSPSLANLFMSSLGCSDKWTFLAISFAYYLTYELIGLFKKLSISCFFFPLLPYLWAHWAVQTGGHLLLSRSLAALFMSSLGCSDRWASLAISFPCFPVYELIGLFRQMS